MSWSQEFGQRPRADSVSCGHMDCNRLEAYLEVDVLQPAHDDAVGSILRDLEALPLLEALNVDRCAHKLSVQRTLICEALDVLGCMRVDVLKRAGELVIEPLDKGNHAARNLEDLPILDGGRLLVILPLLGALNDDDLVAGLEDLQKLAKFLIGPSKCQQMNAFSCMLAELTASTAPGACG